MHILGISCHYHDAAAALLADGELVAAAEEERFSRRKHGKRPVPFSAWELPELSSAWCLAQAGVDGADLDAVAYSFDPGLCRGADELGLSDPWDWLRVEYAKRAPQFLAAALPGLDPGIVRFVPHHVAHAASAGLAAPDGADSAVLVLDGRGEVASHLAGVYRDGQLTPLFAQELPHSLGLLYEDLTENLGFLRSSDEYKVMALASYGHPRFLPALREAIRPTGDGGFAVAPLDWTSFTSAARDGAWDECHADLAASVQARLQEMLLDLARWLHRRTGESALVMAGGVALNCVANSVLAEHGPFERIWVQPAAGDAGTALGAALHAAQRLGDPITPMTTAALGRGWPDDDLQAWLTAAAVPCQRPDDIAEAVAEIIAAGGVVGWFQGRSEFGPRALGHRSLLADAGDPDNVQRLNAIKGRESFRPVSPMVRLERAGEIFEGPLPSPYMLFTHRVRPAWRARIPAVVHVDGTARIQTVDSGEEPRVARMLAAVERRTGLPVVVNTSFNTAGRPMVDDPRDALECFGASPISALALGPFLVRRRR
jgi:carbamoyltransferase